MKKCLNKVSIEGYIYQHTLAVKTVQNQASENFGKEFINGQIDIVVDDEGLNIVPVRYTYVVPTTSKGQVNRTYTVLKGIIDGGKTWVECGTGATKVKCDTSFALNDFYAQDGQLVSQMVQEGGFISTIADFSKDNQGNYTARNKFEIDLLITNVSRVEADEEKGTPEYAKIRAAGFNFRNQILPMDFIIKNPKGIDHVEGLDVSNSNPVFVKTWGVVNNVTTLVNRVEESAFGEASVTSYERKIKEWIITGISPTPYDFGEETVLTVEEVKKALQDREVLLADTKKRSEEYRASTATATAAAATPKASNTTFNF
jgi:hypothetical protein